MILDFRRNKGYVEVKIECHCMNKWWTRPVYIINRGTWCPKCGGTQRKSIEAMQILARKILHGGKCLSDKYLGNKVTLHWECGLCNQKFWKDPHNLQRSDRYGGCPNCLKIKNMSKSYIDILYYLKLSKSMKSADDIALHFGRDYSVIAEIKRNLQKNDLIEKYQDTYSNARYAYKISQKGLRILELHEILNRDI